MISENLVSLRKEIPENVTLVAVSKTKPIEALEEAYRAGQRHFGENKVQELVAKYEKLPKDINWHLIGHLQTNKVKYVAPFVHLIHAVDSEKLLIEIDKQAHKNNRIIDVLLQFHIAQEDTKFGLSMGECKLLLKNSTSFLNTRIIGVMGMASFVDDEDQIRNEFKTLRNIFNELKSQYFGDAPYFSTISMGMSGDYSLAIEEGSTMVRVGSAIFGTR
ncbi:MAG: YggS family pyridoxal phosphate-dependent enzyme [Bacteroidetes bacterium]|nr:YggS family pyridoxal phosphate-dependent enzyme [Bacteroidota bacterium]